MGPMSGGASISGGGEEGVAEGRGEGVGAGSSVRSGPDEVADG